MKKFAVIMAGGGGTRFWPLSRQNAPKQLLNLSGHDVMLNETIKRFDGIIENEDIYVVTGKTQEKPLREVVSDCILPENILYEPVGRNTAPCILYAAVVLQKRYGDGIMCVFPSDHYIEQNARFKSILQQCIQTAQELEGLVTIGIQPQFAATGYGYIKYSDFNRYNGAYKVEEFIEKPNYKTAEMYLKAGDYLWNSGMFVWRVSTIIANFQRFLPRLYEKVQLIADSMGKPEEQEILENVYPKLQNISIDYGILERSGDVFAVPGDFGWNDVGSWEALGSIFPADHYGNIVKADHIGIESHNCIIYGNDKLISTIGLENMIIVNTEDALLVCPKNKAQDVKKVIEKLKEKGRADLL